MLSPAPRCQSGQSQQTQRCDGWFRHGEADIAGGRVDDAYSLKLRPVAVEREVLRHIGAGSQRQLRSVCRCDQQCAYIGEER